MPTPTQPLAPSASPFIFLPRVLCARLVSFSMAALGVVGGCGGGGGGVAGGLLRANCDHVGTADADIKVLILHLPPSPLCPSTLLSLGAHGYYQGFPISKLGVGSPGWSRVPSFWSTSETWIQSGTCSLSVFRLMDCLLFAGREFVLHFRGKVNGHCAALPTVLSSATIYIIYINIVFSCHQRQCNFHFKNCNAYNAII